MNRASWPQHSRSVAPAGGRLQRCGNSPLAHVSPWRRWFSRGLRPGVIYLHFGGFTGSVQESFFPSGIFCLKLHKTGLFFQYLLLFCCQKVSVRQRFILCGGRIHWWGMLQWRRWRWFELLVNLWSVVFDLWSSLQLHCSKAFWTLGTRTIPAVQKGQGNRVHKKQPPPLTPPTCTWATRESRAASRINPFLAEKTWLGKTSVFEMIIRKPETKLDYLNIRYSISAQAKFRGLSEVSIDRPNPPQVNKPADFFFGFNRFPKKERSTIHMHMQHDTAYTFCSCVPHVWRWYNCVQKLGEKMQ